MSLNIIGEVAMKIMDAYAEFTQPHPRRWVPASARA
jgi:hypothetical protein